MPNHKKIIEIACSCKRKRETTSGKWKEIATFEREERGRGENVHEREAWLVQLRLIHLLHLAVVKGNDQVTVVAQSVADL